MTLSLDSYPALVLIDLQKTIAQAVPARPAIQHAAQLAAAFRHRGLPVVLVGLASRHGSAPPGRTDRPRLQPPTSATPSDGHHFIDDLSRHPDDIVITKRNWGAFYGTDLDLHLRRRGVTQIVLGGVATSIGVESTARSAHEHGYHLTLVTDAMADLDPDAHRHTVDKIFPLIGQIGTTAEVLALLESAQVGAAPIIP